MTILERQKDKATQQTFERFYRNGKMNLLKVRLLCMVIFYIFIVMIPLMVLNYKFELYKLPNLVQFIFCLLYFIFCYVLYLLLKDSYLGTEVYLIYYKCINFLFFRLYTCKGEAIKTSDFKEIKLNNKTLYDDISTDECQGQCYATCFDILKTLKKGQITFLVIGIHYYDKPSMHVLYVNNGWCFDTNCRNQIEYEKYLNENDVCVFKQFDYESIKGLSYEEFRRKHRKEIEDWCTENNYFSFSHM